MLLFVLWISFLPLFTLCICFGSMFLARAICPSCKQKARVFNGFLSSLAGFDIPVTSWWMAHKTLHCNCRAKTLRALQISAQKPWRLLIQATKKWNHTSYEDKAHPFASLNYKGVAFVSYSSAAGGWQATGKPRKQAPSSLTVVGWVLGWWCKSFWHVCSKLSPTTTCFFTY